MSDNNTNPAVAPGGTTAPPRALNPSWLAGNQGIPSTVPVPYYTHTMPGGPQSVYSMPVEPGQCREWGIPVQPLTTDYKP